MTVTLTEIRQEIAQLISDNVLDATVLWYGLAPDSTIPRPRISLEPAGDYIAYYRTQDQQADMQLVAVVELMAQDDETLAIHMDQYLDPGSDQSIASVLQSDPTLGGRVADCVALTARMNPDDPFRAEVDIMVMFE